MEKKRFLLFGAGILAILLVTVLVVIWANVREVKSEEQKQQLERTEMLEEMPTNTMETNTTKQSEMLPYTASLPEPMENTTETGAKGEQAVLFYMDSLYSFLSKEQIEEVKERILELLPEDAGEDTLWEVSCLTYQKVSVKEMNVTFYLCDSADNVYEGYYKFNTAKLTVEKSDTTKEELEALEKEELEEIAASEQEEQEKITRQLESERAAESERVAESEKTAQEKREARKKKKEEPESEAETIKSPEQAAYKTTVD